MLLPRVYLPLFPVDSTNLKVNLSALRVRSSEALRREPFGDSGQCRPSL